ncbi:MAG: glycosyltransferase family 4 protein [Candidatus Limnocylindrales bacterium]
MTEARRPRLALIGAGTRFLSGPSYHTRDLAGALAGPFDVLLITMRRLLPTRLYPGHTRVGAKLMLDGYDARVRVVDGVDWYWLPSMLRAVGSLVRHRPDLVIFEWWTGAVLHSYLLLALVARAMRAQVVIEIHEVLDPGEARIGWVDRYVRTFSPLFMRLAQAFIAHSSTDVAMLRRSLHLHDRPVHVIPMGPPGGVISSEASVAWREAPPEACNILSFGLIRPYKGVEQLVRAFGALEDGEVGDYWLTIAGETWEGWDLPAQEITASPHRDLITTIGHYIDDRDVAALFRGADGAVLAYSRSLGSAALHLCLAHGLPVVITGIPALREAVADYEGVRVVPVGDVPALTEALRWLRTQKGRRFPDPHSWERVVQRYLSLSRDLGDDRSPDREAAPRA